MIKIFVLRISGNWDSRGVRTTTVCDVKMMYSQKWYMENVPAQARVWLGVATPLSSLVVEEFLLAPKSSSLTHVPEGWRSKAPESENSPHTSTNVCDHH